MPAKKTKKDDAAKKKPKKKASPKKPAKKSEKKPKPKKAAKKKVEKKHEEIKKAVEKIPAMVMKDVKPEPTPPPPPKKRDVVDPIEHDRSKFIWLWTGVAIFALTILIIWVFNTKAFIENSAFNRDPKTNLLELGKDDFANTVKLINDSDNTDELIKAQQEAARAEEAKENEKKTEEAEGKETKEELNDETYAEAEEVETNKSLKNSILLLLKKETNDEPGEDVTSTPEQ